MTAPVASVDAVIRLSFEGVWSESRTEPAPPLASETVLLETGLDSMAFAMFVADLEDQLGYDPFALAVDAYYPTTFGDFVSFYEKFAEHRTT